MQIKKKNAGAVLLLTICLGAMVGLVLWLFLRAMALGTELVWQVLPRVSGIRWITVPLCAAGGLTVGVLHKIYGDYPESLDVVMGKVKKEKHYDYSHFLPMLICALIPLVFGSSVGPEAGLTGIIAALCYWIGDNVSFAKQNAALYSELGEAVTLGQLFHMPLFGILAVEETPGDEIEVQPMSKSWKLVLYGISAAAGFLAMALLNRLFHLDAAGFPKFSEVPVHMADLALCVIYIPLGILLCMIFEKAEHLSNAAAEHVPVILRETICGAGIGLVGLAVPMALFSGEEQMAELMAAPGACLPPVLIGVCLIKLVLTAFCLSFGMKGGHFFPLIFACTAMGFGLSGLMFSTGEHAAFAACVITAATLGAQMKKPLVVSVLLLLCFPPRLLLWIFLAAAIGGKTAEKLEKKA